MEFSVSNASVAWALPCSWGVNSRTHPAWLEASRNTSVRCSNSLGLRDYATGSDSHRHLQTEAERGGRRGVSSWASDTTFVHLTFFPWHLQTDQDPKLCYDLKSVCFMLPTAAFQSEVCIKTQSSGLLGLQLGPETRQMREIPTLRIWMWVRDPRRSPAITKKGMKNS